MKHAITLGILLLTANVSVPGAVRAQPEKNPQNPWYLSDQDAETTRWWRFELLLGVESEPDYPGSDDNELEPDLLVRAVLRDRWENRYFLSPGELTGVFDLGKNTALQVKLELEEGREVENVALTGFEKGETTLEGEISFFQRFGNFTLAGVFQPDILDKGKGIVWFLGAAYDRMLGEKWRIGPRLDVSWADAEHMQTEFGVTTEQALASGLPEYRPGGGLKSSTAGLSLQYFFKRRWSLLADFELEYYFDKASSSPLIELEGSDLTYEALIGVFFTF